MIDVAAAKAWIKKETNDEDALIGGLVNAAVATIEAQTGKFLDGEGLHAGARRLSRPARPTSIKLSRGPVTAIMAIEYDPSDGTAAVEVDEFRLIEG
jgi:uncharacterized phiE125 gp8 family phage protein